MRLLSGLLCAAVVAIPSLAFAGPDTSAPAAAPGPARRTGWATNKGPPPAADPATPAVKRISLQYRGRLGEALKKIASEGGLSVVITGSMDDLAEVVLHDVPASDALESIAKAHQLDVQRTGSVWTVKKATGEETEETEDAEDADDSEEEAEAPAVPATPVAPAAPLPALPPLPAAPRPVDAEDLGRRLEDRLLGKLKRHRHHGQHPDLSGAGNLTVEEGETVDDVVSFGGNVTVKGHVEGDAVSIGGNVHLAKTAVVDGQVVCVGGGVDREEGARIRGEMLEVGGSRAGKTIAKMVAKAYREDRESESEDESSESEVRPHRSHHGVHLPSFLLEFAALFGIGFIFRTIAPTRMKQLSAELKRNPVRCGVVGSVGLVALFPLTLILIISIIGIPFAALLWVLVGLIVPAGLSAVATEIGMRVPVLGVRRTQAVVLAAGLLVLLLIGQIPVLGTLLLVLVCVATLGAIIRMWLGRGIRDGIPEPL